MSPMNFEELQKIKDERNPKLVVDIACVLDGRLALFATIVRNAADQEVRLCFVIQEIETWETRHNPLLRIFYLSVVYFDLYKGALVTLMTKIVLWDGKEPSQDQIHAALVNLMWDRIPYPPKGATDEG